MFDSAIQRDGVRRLRRSEKLAPVSALLRLLAFLAASTLLLLAVLTLVSIGQGVKSADSLPIVLLVAALTAAIVWRLLPTELRYPHRGEQALLTRLLRVCDRFEARLLSTRPEWSAEDLALLDRNLGGWRGALVLAGAVLLVSAPAVAFANGGSELLAFGEKWNLRFVGYWMVLLLALMAGVLRLANLWFGYRKYHGRMVRWLALYLGVAALLKAPDLIAQYQAIRAGRAVFDPKQIAGIEYLWLVGLAIVVFTMIAMLRNREHEARVAKLTADAERERLAYELTASQLKLLQAQIEPHFLFNTLGTVQHLSEGKSDDAVVLLGRLIHFLRGSMTNLRLEHTDLRTERALVSAYLDVMKARMGARFDYAFDFPEELLSQPIPPTMLITLVENAIKHGIEPKLKGGRIDISARQEGERMRLTVADTGRGFSDISGTGVGLANIRERLELSYGAAAELELEENEPEGFIAHLLVPLPCGPQPLAPTQEIATA